MPNSSGPAWPDPVLGIELCQAIRRQVEKLGLTIGDEPIWAEASFAEQRDPFSGESSLVGVWKGKARYGTVTLFPDGRIFAEYQVLLPHPVQSGQYVESVQVWGRSGALKGDPVLAAFVTS
ncbi:MAG: hypothetical protein Q8S26_14705 [Azonexus sp.]|nr:hypothetical protein [Azonexus sp.]